MKGFFREVKRINWTGTFFGSKKRVGVTLLIGIPAVVSAASFGYQYYLQLNPQIVYQHKISSMTQQMSKTLTLPKDEKPTVATVTDTKLLPKEEFFAFAQNGDKIFMYKKHKLAVLYRPSTGQVITKAILVFADPTPTPKVQAQAVAGASTSASPSAVSAPDTSPTPGPTTVYHPQGKILVVPQQ